MTPSPAELLVVGPTARDALLRLDDAASEITVRSELHTVPAQPFVLLTGDVPVATAEHLAAADGDTVVAVDLMSPPAPATLACLTGRFHDRFARWGDLPVALLTADGVRPFDRAALGEVADLLDAGAQPTDETSLLRTALDQADADRRELGLQIRRLTGLLDTARADAARVSAEHDETTRRLRALEGRRAVRVADRVGRMTRRRSDGGGQSRS